ncbi:MAG TPA: protease complex subunit PrcB family protein [bacterium]|nr:protease complex subunit PrcB family protein [bacterium]
MRFPMLVVGLCVLAGCGGGSTVLPPADPDPDPTFTTLTFQTAHQGTGPYTFIFNAPAPFAAYWRAVFGTDNEPSLPAVDFAHSTVLVIAAGQFPQGEYRIAVDRLSFDPDGALRVDYAVVRPGAGCVQDPGPSNPVLIGVTEQHQGAVNWVRALRPGAPCPDPAGAAEP